MKNSDKIYTEGDYAYYDGKELIDNPYYEDMEEYIFWAEGWRAAREGAIEESEYVREDYFYGY